ncbi:GntR family transcriptional regulator [Aeromicrobium panaciterrae]|uniref:GntR family transcriptional regulator n=1 Tax=Aeromicrobium panaciterrae TaxID=363861 RepID=UPI0031D35114
MARAAETAYAVIRAGILSGEFERGERLREEELAVKVGVSRTPVREALRRLDAEGLVQFQPNRGARVSARSAQELEDLYDLRAMLEGYGARLAASRASDAEISELADLAVRMEAVTKSASFDVDELTRLNGEFHWSIVRASRNSQLDALIRGVIDVPLAHHTFERYEPERLQASHSHHRELVSALQAHDGQWAEAVMRSHILAARTTVLNSLQGHSDPGTARVASGKDPQAS